jgi:hypothetical protein
MKYISPLISDGRGSIGGQTWARNSTGVYIRARTSPAQPRTASQVANRANFTLATQAWATLTPATRQAWMAYAETTTIKDSLGQSYIPSGYQVFCTCMRNLQQLGDPAIPDVPTAPLPQPPGTYLGLGNVTTAGVLTQVLAILTPDWTYWSAKTVLQATAPVNPTVLFTARANYRNIPLTGAYSGDQIDCLAAYTAVFGAAASPGQWIWSRIRFINDATGQAGPWNKAPYGNISGT